MFVREFGQASHDKLRNILCRRVPEKGPNDGPPEYSNGVDAHEFSDER